MPRQRKLRDKRPKQPKAIRLNERDIHILQALYDYRYLDSKQIQRLFFPSLHRAYERLQQLYENAYVERIFRGKYMDKMNTAIIYVLDKKGLALLEENLAIDLGWKAKQTDVSEFFLEHNLAINEVRIAVTLACQELGLTILTWKHEHELRATPLKVRVELPKGGLQERKLIPDSYFRISYKGKVMRFFLEMDMGTMTLKRFQDKVLAYNAYGDLEKRNISPYVGFRVLTVSPSAIRLKHLKAATESIGGENRFWFSSLEAIQENQVLNTPIWLKAQTQELLALLS